MGPAKGKGKYRDSPMQRCGSQNRVSGVHRFMCWELRVLGGGDDQTVAEEAGRPRVKGWGSVCPLGNRKPVELYLPGNSVMRLVLL